MMPDLWRLFLLCCLVALGGAMAAGASPAVSTAASHSPLLDALARMPSCARICVVGAVEGSQCLPTDAACICADEEMQAAATECVKQTCTIKESLATKNLTMSSCGAPIRDASGSYVVMSNVLAALIAICVLQRMGSKLFWRLGVELDDWIILLTTLCLTTPCLIINVHGLVANGMGRDIWTLPSDQITRFGTFFHVMASLYFLQMATIKLTLLVFYLRIFPAPTVRRLLWATIIFAILYGGVFLFTAVFQCRPISHFATKWDGEHEGTCASINAITWSNAAISIVLDLWMLGIPVWQLKQLNLDWRKKVGVIMMFFVGTLFTVVSIIRLHVLVKFGHTENPTWDYLEVCRWSTIEIAVGVICVCMPSFRLLLVRLFPSIFSRARSYANYSSEPNFSRKSKSINMSLGLASRSGKGDSYPADSSKGGITLSRGYTVELTDRDENDELHLVHGTVFRTVT